MTFGKPDAGKPPVRFDEGRSETVIGLVPLQPVRSAYSTLGDTVMETNETFLVKLTSPANATLAISQAVGTIVDDDFKVTAVALVGADVRLNFATLSGQSYRVERTDSLIPPVPWTPVTGAENVSGTGGVVEALYLNAASQPQRFYRVRLLP